MASRATGITWGDPQAGHVAFAQLVTRTFYLLGGEWSPPRGRPVRGTPAPDTEAGKLPDHGSRMGLAVTDVDRAAGWEAIGEEAERLEMAIRGEAGRYTLAAHRSVLMLDNPVLELCDSDRSRVAWVRKVPTPERAAELLARFGVPADEAGTADPATSPLPPRYRRKRIGDGSAKILRPGRDG